MRFFIFTDIPVWVRPLARALDARGADVSVSDSPGAIRHGDAVINRISTQVARKEPRQAEAMRAALQKWENQGRRVINGARCLEVGFSKWAQAELMERCGVLAPRTEIARAGTRSIRDQPVLLKPAAGGFGRDIQRLGVNEPVPADVENEPGRIWVEQAILTPADGAVHRVETVGSEAMYEAVSPVTPDCFDYCLAHASEQVRLRRGADLPGSITTAIAQLTKAAAMELGSLEYLLDAEGRPHFIDINPVSSLHPNAASVLGQDPIERTVDYLVGGMNRGRR